jgi:glyoxylase-like metal-dependent hydrolase (beta-lactamase superfamily II)
MKWERREFLTLLAGAAALRPASAQAAITVSPLSDRLSLLTGAGNNIVIAAGPNGALLVDCGDAAHAADVLARAGRVAAVINTHWHLESTGGNDAMAQAGAKIIAHHNTKGWMTQEITHDWEKREFAPRATIALPTETFLATHSLDWAGERVELGLLPMAHTDGDIYVHFPQANVLVVGDAVQPGRLPFLDWFTGGWIGGMQNAHQSLLRLANDATKIVPGAGPVISRAELQANLEILTQLREKLVTLMKQGKGPQDWIDAQAAAEFQDRLAGDPAQFLYRAYRGLWGHVRELGGIV